MHLLLAFTYERCLKYFSRGRSRERWGPAHIPGLPQPPLQRELLLSRHATVGTAVTCVWVVAICLPLAVL